MTDAYIAMDAEDSSEFSAVVMMIDYGIAEFVEVASADSAKEVLALALGMELVERNASLY